METLQPLEMNNATSSQGTPARGPKRKKPDSDDSPNKGVLANLPGDICGHCKERCTETGKQGQAVQCDLCGVWVHASCDGISVDQYELLVSLTSSIENIAYLCKLNSCQSRLKQLILKSVEVVDNHDDLSSRLDKVEVKLDEIIHKVGSELENHNKTIQSLPNNTSAVETKLNKVVQELGTRLDSHCKSIKAMPTNAPDLATTIVNVTSSLAIEQREKERRQLNLILHNAPESKSSDPNTRKKEDIDFTQSTFLNILGTPVTITNAVRLGKKESHDRLLKITVESLDQKKAILRNKIKLRGQENSDHICKLFITPDLTPKEQKESKELRSKLAEMNKSGKKYKIKNGQIVQRVD